MLVVLVPRALVAQNPLPGVTNATKANETNRPQWSVFSCPFSVLGYMFLLNPPPQSSPLPFYNRWWIAESCTQPVASGKSLSSLGFVVVAIMAT